MLPESKLGRNSSLQEWQWVYPEQEVDFLCGIYDKAHGKQKSK